MLALGRTWAAVAVAAILVGTGAAVAEAARPVEAFRWHDEEDFITQRCGVDVRIQLVASGNTIARVPGTDGIPRYTTTWRGDATWTNVATGNAFTFHWATNGHDLSATDNGDGTLTILVQTGGHESIYGPDGQRVAKLAGTFVERVLIDDAGTPADPSDDQFIGAELVTEHGPPPPDSDFCTEFRTLTG